MVFEMHTLWNIVQSKSLRRELYFDILLFTLITQGVPKQTVACKQCWTQDRQQIVQTLLQSCLLF